MGWHLRSGRVPEPGDREGLDAFVAREMSRRIDRSRPLWELHVVDGLEDGARIALVPKMHHALVDGLAAVGVGMILLDPTPEPIEPPPGPWRPRRLRRAPPSRAPRRASADARPRARGRSTLRALETTAAAKAADDLRRATDLVVELWRAAPHRA